MFKRFLLFRFALFVYCITALSAQDPQFSQFFANRTYLNPAYAGFDPGWTLEVNHRDQWFGVPDASSGPFSGGYRLSSVALSNQAPCAFNLQGANFGYSLTAFNDEAGIAGLKTQGAGLAVSLEIPLTGANSKTWVKRGLTRLDLRIGAQHSIAQRSLSDDYFIYSNQLDPVLGLLNANPPSGLDLVVPTYQNSKVGLMLRGALRLKQPGAKKKRVRENDRILFTLGMAISNIQQPDISFFEGGNPALLPRRLTIHAGAAFSMLRLKGGRKNSEYLSMAPQFRWDTQMGGLLNTFTFGANFFQRSTYLGAFYTFNTPNGVGPAAISLDPVLAGGVRSVTITGGLRINIKNNYHTTYRNRRRGEQNLQLALSYDLVTGGLSRSTGGVLEISAKINLSNGHQTDCGELAEFELYKGDCPAKF